MPINWGGILQGAITGARGIQEGKSERRKMEQQALRQALADRLLTAQIGNYESLAAERRNPRAVPPVHLSPVIDPVTGEVSGYDPVANTLTPSGGRIHPKPAVPKPPNADQTRLADFGTRLLEGHRIMADLETRVPGIGQNVDKKVRGVLAAERVPGVGGVISTILTPAALASMSPEERAYWAAMQDVGNARLRRASGAQINKEEYDREIRPLVPTLGEDESTVQAKQQRRLQAARLYIRGAGSAFQPDLLSPEARAYLDSLSEVEAPKRETPDTAPKPKYHPRFRRP